jgi:hypothetical protein
MYRVAVLLLASGIAACAAESRHRPEVESDRRPSTTSYAGSGAFDPSLDTPREMPEEAGSGNVEPPPPRPQSSDAHGMGGGQETDAAAAVRCPSLALVADDGTFLGVASSRARAADSVCNPAGDYGSQDGPYSIYNPTSPYGNTSSQTSAFNATASRPPRLFCESTEVLLNPVTKNVFLPGAIDPDALCATLAGSGY